MHPKQQKKHLRQELHNQIAQLAPGYCHAADTAILQQLQSTALYLEADTIFCYAGTDREIDTMPMICDALERGKRVGVPRCTAPGVMEVCQIMGAEDLAPGFYGIREPGRHCPVLMPNSLDLAVIPCLSCTSKGVRLGYGGGYYDRYLTGFQGWKIALCRGRMLCETIPKEPHDLLMDMIITEGSMIYC